MPFEENQAQIERGEVIERIWPDLERWFDEKIKSRQQTLENRKFSNMVEVNTEQNSIQDIRELEEKFQGWISKKNKLLAERRDNSK